MDVKIEESWKNLLYAEFEKDYFHQLIQFIKKEYQTKKVYPPGSLIFSAFDHCPFDKTKVVIVGQDPYHGPNQANGLCFSVKNGIKHPPSLQNIFKELKDDIRKPIPISGDLQSWADQGVLLLNATLTVRAGQAGSHQNKGWEEFTDEVLHQVSENKENVVFLLWGAYAQKKGAFIDPEKHCILKAPHPSPFSANNGFFGCKHFSKTNQFLQSNGLGTIDW
ncbi:MAG: uracil-DNA glycosylase [Bacteroidota bacterium]